MGLAKRTGTAGRPRARFGPPVDRTRRRGSAVPARLALVTLLVAVALTGCAAWSPAPSAAVVGSAPSHSIGPPPLVDAHDGSIVQDGTTFWLFGTAYDCGFALGKIGTPWCGIRAFSSTDFVHWSPQGYAVAPTVL